MNERVLAKLYGLVVEDRLVDPSTGKEWTPIFWQTGMASWGWVPQIYNPKHEKSIEEALAAWTASGCPIPRSKT